MPDRASVSDTFLAAEWYGPTSRVVRYPFHSVAVGELGRDPNDESLWRVVATWDADGGTFARFVRAPQAASAAEERIQGGEQ